MTATKANYKTRHTALSKNKELGSEISTNQTKTGYLPNADRHLNALRTCATRVAASHLEKTIDQGVHTTTGAAPLFSLAGLGC